MQVLGDVEQHLGLAAVFAHEAGDAGRQLGAHVVHHFAQGLDVHGTGLDRQHLDAVDVFNSAHHVAAGSGLSLFEFLAQGLDFLLHGVHAGSKVGRAHLEHGGKLVQFGAALGHDSVGVPAGSGFDAAHTGGHAAFGQDDERTGLTRAGKVRAAAEFHGAGSFAFTAHEEHAHLVAVLFVEQGQSAGLHGLVVAHFLGHHGVVGKDHGIHFAFHGADLFGSHGRDMREVEAQMVGADRRTGLMHMRTQHLAQGGLQEMGAGMVAHGVEADAFGHFEADFLIGMDNAFGHFHLHHDEGGHGLDGVGDFQLAFGGGDEAGVAHLAAASAVERRLEGDDKALVAHVQHVHGQGVFVEQGHDAGIGLEEVIAHEFGLHAFFEQALEAAGKVLFTGTLPRGAGAFALGLHMFEEAFLVHGEAALVGHVGNDVEREAEGVVEAEGHFTGDDSLAFGGKGGELAVEHGEALVEGHAEAVLFLEDHLGDEVGVFAQFGVVVAHDVDHLAHGLVQEGFLHAHEGGEAQGAADEAAKHVAAAFVGGKDAVGNHEGRGTAVVGNDAQGGIHVVGVGSGEGIFHARHGSGVLDDVLEQVAVEVGALALADGGDALEAHAGIDVGMFEQFALAGLLLVVLGEHEVPDLKEAVAVALADAAVRAALHVFALIHVDFGAGAAGAGVAHSPEVVLLAHADDAFGSEAGNLLPEGEGFVVILEHGDVEAFLGKLQLFGDEFPCVGDGFALEVGGKGEVAQHFEEGVVAGGAAHVLKVVVLAAHAEALLGGGGAVVGTLLLPEVHLLELHHAGVGEHQRGVVLGNEGGGRLDGVAVLAEILKEFMADLFSGKHRGSLSEGCFKAHRGVSSPAHIKVGSYQYSS